MKLRILSEPGCYSPDRLPGASSVFFGISPRTNPGRSRGSARLRSVPIGVRVDSPTTKRAVFRVRRHDKLSSLGTPAPVRSGLVHGAKGRLAARTVAISTSVATLRAGPLSGMDAATARATENAWRAPAPSSAFASSRPIRANVTARRFFNLGGRGPGSGESARRFVARSHLCGGGRHPDVLL